jgi:fibronectin-binding autotransporter adhesin
LNGSTMAISVASPQGWSGMMTYRINGDYSGTNAVWNSSAGYTTLSFALPSGSFAGNTVTQDFQLISSGGTLSACYFTGGIDGKWNTISGGISNFATSQTGTTNAAGTPGVQTDVFLDANTAGNLTTTLGQNFTINSLTFTGTGTAGISPTSVNGTNTLTLMAAAGSYTAGTGIIVNPGAAADTIGENVALGSTQSWNNSSANPFTVSGNLTLATYSLTASGTGSKTISGNITGTGGITLTSGSLTLAGSNHFTGGTTIAGGNLLVTNSMALGTGAVVSSNAGTSNGTLQLAGGITLTNAITKLASRYDPAATPTGAAQIENISGSNTLTSPLSISSAGGSGILIESDSGTLTLSGGITGNLSGSSYIRPVYFYGAGNGVVTGTIANGVPLNGISITKEGAGSWTFAAADTYTGATTIEGGTLVFAAPGALPAFTGLSIAAGATAVAATHPTKTAGAAKNNLFVSSLTIAGSTGAWTGKLDLVNNDLVVQNGNLAQITNQVAQGFAGGFWDGTGGIISTSASEDSTHLTTLGVIQNSVNGAMLYSSSNPFDGANASAATDILIKSTYYGDTNLDGEVDGSDYSRIDNAYLADQTNPTAYTGWGNGDFNYDGIINGSDYTLIDNAFNTQGADIASALAIPTVQINDTSQVPEPTMLTLIGMAGIGLLGRRRWSDR